MYLISQGKNGHSILSLKRFLGVSYRTAWRLKHKILDVMVEAESGRKLSGRVVADDAYLGGVHHGKRGRGSENKAPIIVAIQCNDKDRPLYARLDSLPDLKGASVKAWAGKALDASVHLVTDGLASLAAAANEVAEHTPIIVSPRKSSEREEFHWVNTVISNLKTALNGTYHHIKVPKYVAHYLAEFQYRFNHRFDVRGLVQQLLDACIATPPRPERWLRLGKVRTS